MNLEPRDLERLGGLSAEQLAECLSPEQIDELLAYQHYMEEYPRECRADIIKLIRYGMPGKERPFDARYSRYDSTTVHQFLADAFEKVLQGEWRRLIISIRPQIGKSTIAKHFLASHMGRFPWKHLMCGMYNETFAKEYGADVRNIVTSEWYRRVYPEVQMAKGSSAKDYMQTTEGGKLAFIGRKGSGTGKPADGFLVDDPIKSPQEVRSKTTRDEMWKWFTGVVNTRCHVLSWQVIIATRWSDDDIIARLTDPKNPFYDAEVAKEWRVINLPAIVDDEELAKALGMKVGTQLWPNRFSMSDLESARRMDPVTFSALYMGRPTPAEGSFYKEDELPTYQHDSERPTNVRCYITGDLAVSPAIHADRTCVGVWALDEFDELWLLPELYWEKKSSVESIDQIIAMGVQYSVVEMFWEKGQIEKGVGPFLGKRIDEEMKKGVPAYFNVTPLPVKGDKGTRSLPFRGRAKQGKVHFPAFAPWWSRAKEQMLSFTGTGDDKEDDFADMCALIGQALEMQIPASAGAKVIKLPKVGTFAWTVSASRREQEQKKRTAALKGM